MIAVKSSHFEGVRFIQTGYSLKNFRKAAKAPPRRLKSRLESQRRVRKDFNRHGSRNVG